MGIVNLLGLPALCALLSLRFRERLTETLPVALGLWLLLLMALAFFRALSAIDFVSLALLAAAVILILRLQRERRRDFLRDTLGDSSALMMLGAFGLLFLLLRGKEPGAWDEMGVWALETKNLYLLDGFSGPYRNVAVRFGDYSPGLMLFLWWAAHLFPRGFQGGMLYVGVWWLFAAYLMPLAGRLRLRRIWALPVGVLVGLLILILPSTVDGSDYYCIMCELPMSAVFALFLWCLFDPAEHRRGFQGLRLFSCAAVLMLLKTTGLLYGAALLALGLVLRAVRRRGGEGVPRPIDRLPWWGFLTVGVLAALPALNWRLYCSAAGRSSYFETAWSNLAKGYDYLCYNFEVPFCSFPEFLPMMVKCFLRTVVTIPLHNYAAVTLDLSAMTLVLLLAGLAVLAWRKKLLSRRELVSLSACYAAALLAFSAGLLFILVFIFQEGSYADPEVMIIAIARYGQPLFLGALLFMAHLWLPEETPCLKKPWRSRTLLFACAVLLCCRMGMVWEHTVDYRAANAVRQEMAQESEEYYSDFRAALETAEGEDARILYLYQGEWEDEMLQRFLQFEQAPRSICFERVGSVRDEEALLRELCGKYRPDALYFRGMESPVFAGFPTGDGEGKGRLVKLEDGGEP